MALRFQEDPDYDGPLAVYANLLCLTLRLLHAAKGYKAVAFDIFDTLLKRDCAHPADLFALMEVTHQAALGFAGARAAAEAETRQTLGREVTLAEIYAHPALRGTDPAAECAAELAMIAPNRPVAQAAAACHARGQKVYAVSDMYLPKEQIEAMTRAAMQGANVEFAQNLRHHGFCQN